MPCRLFGARRDPTWTALCCSSSMPIAFSPRAGSKQVSAQRAAQLFTFSGVYAHAAAEMVSPPYPMRVASRLCFYSAWRFCGCGRCPCAPIADGPSLVTVLGWRFSQFSGNYPARTSVVLLHGFSKHVVLRVCALRAAVGDATVCSLHFSLSWRLGLSARRSAGGHEHRPLWHLRS